MAIEAGEAPSPPSHLTSHFTQQRHFYVAVDRLQFKMETLVDLLGVAGRRSCLPMVVCCSSRDELDAVCSAVSNLPYIFLTSLYSDLAEAERALVLDKFRQATMNWNQNISAQPGEDSEVGKDEQKSHMVVVTDACLPFLACGESAISARVLINYELPTKKCLCWLTGNIYEAHGNLFGSRWDCNQYGCWGRSGHSQKHRRKQ